MKKFIISISAIVVVIIVFLMFISSVPTGYTGIVTIFGKVQDETYDAGLHFCPPWYSVIKINNRVQKESIDLMCFSSDIQEVSMKYTINYQIDSANAQNLYRSIGKDYYNKIVIPSITESVKTVTAKFTAEKIIGERNELAINIEKELRERLAEYNIKLVATSIEDIDFSDLYTDSIEKKQVAQQDKLRAETEAEQRRVEAQAAADVKAIESQATANALLIEAEAEAKANKMISDSISDKILDKMYYDRWDGKLPTTVLGADDKVIYNGVH